MHFTYFSYNTRIVRVMGPLKFSEFLEKILRVWGNKGMGGIRVPLVNMYMYVCMYMKIRWLKCRCSKGYGTIEVLGKVENFCEVSSEGAYSNLKHPLSLVFSLLLIQI